MKLNLPFSSHPFHFSFSSIEVTTLARNLPCIFWHFTIEGHIILFCVVFELDKGYLLQLVFWPIPLRGFTHIDLHSPFIFKSWISAHCLNSPLMNMSVAFTFLLSQVLQWNSWVCSWVCSPKCSCKSFSGAQAPWWNFAVVGDAHFLLHWISSG